MNIEVNDKGIQAHQESPHHHSTDVTSSVDDSSHMMAHLPIEKTKRKSLYCPKKKYAIINKDLREKFIQRVLSKQISIKEAAEECGIKFSTSKAILQTFRREGRVGKKKTRERRRKLFGSEITNEYIKNLKLFGSIESPASTQVSNTNSAMSHGMNLCSQGSTMTPAATQLPSAMPLLKSSTELSGQALIAKLTALPRSTLEQVPNLVGELQQLGTYLKAADLLQSVIRIQQEEIQRSILNYAQNKVAQQLPPAGIFPFLMPKAPFSSKFSFTLSF